MTGEQDPRRQPPKKLGRGLDALLRVPVEISIPRDRAGTGTGTGSGAVAGAGAGTAAGTGDQPAETLQSDSVAGGSGSAAEDSVPQATGASGGMLARHGGESRTSKPSPSTAHSGDATTDLPAGRSAGLVTSGSLAAVAGQRSVPRGTSGAETSGRAVDELARGTGEAPSRAEGLVQLSPDQLRPNSRQPRQEFDPTAIASLADSIRVAGIMQPIVVRPSADGAYEIIAGERRWRAARQLGLDAIPAIVREVDDQTAAEWALIENIQRTDLNPIERATGLRRLIDDFGLTHQELGERVGLDRVSISNLLRLCDLDPFSRDAVRSGKLSQGHAKALLAVGQLDLRQTLAAAAISGDWSVRELERRVRHTVEAPRTNESYGMGPPIKSSAHLEDLERRLSEHLGSRVSIHLGRKKGSGQLTIDFYSLDQFDGILARLGFRQSS